MKKVLIAIILLCVVAKAKAIGIKLYIGSAEMVEGTTTAYNLQLVVCNNTTDTIYIPEQQLERVQPTITNDISQITEGGSYMMLNNVPSLVTDMNELRKGINKPDKYRQPTVTGLDKKRIAENSQLQKVDVAGASCYMFAPAQCVTIHCLVLTFPPEFLKLGKLPEQQTAQMEAYLVMPVEYFSTRYPAGKGTILISRSSDDLKNHILKSAEKK